MSTTMVVTDAAARKVKQLIDEEGNSEYKLRVSITGGGCSGLKYSFTFDKQTDESDWVLVKSVEADEETQAGEVMVVIDPMSYGYLSSAEIDYKELEGTFVVRNPNAQTTCGCGSSFSTEA